MTASYRSCSVSIILRCEDPPSIGTDAKHGEVISRHVLRRLRFRGLVAAGAANAHQTAAGLEGGKLGETLRTVAERLVFVVGEDRPVILQATVHAAVLVVADSIEFTRLRHRQGLQQYGMYECEDRRRCADSQRKRQHCRCRKPGSVCKLSHRVTDIFH